jgi:hypothetical protein
MSNPYRYLKNTVSGVVSEFDDKTATRYLKIYSDILVEVPRRKNEVLAEPYKIQDGERHTLVENPTPDVEAADSSAKKENKK